MSPPAQRPGHVSPWSILWALVPLISFGVLTPIIIGHAAARLRSVTTTIAAILYTAALVLFVATPYEEEPSVAADAFQFICFLAPWFGGTVHALFLRRRVFTPRVDPTGNLAALQMVKFRRELRAQARHIVNDDPSLARELCIGRPDLPRTYDDGGLVDVNHAPAHALITATGISPTTAAQIIQIRESQGSFVSAEEVAALTGLDPRLVQHFAEHTIYLPHD